MHPWHDISPGDELPEFVNAVIEIPKRSRAKYELDKPTGLLKLDRVLYSSFFYPANYGFIPRTYCDDNDPLDILILSDEIIPPMCIVKAKVIGAMRMLDEGEEDDKIIAVAARDMGVSHISGMRDLPSHFMDEIKHFFEEYKKLENKEVAVEQFVGRARACNIVQDAIDLYQKEQDHIKSSY